MPGFSTNRLFGREAYGHCCPPARSCVILNVMGRFLFFALALLVAAPCSSSGQEEEFFITCDAPVIIGGGIARHFVYNPSGRLSTRYSFAGTEGDAVLIERTSVDSSDGSESREIMKITLSGTASKKIGRLEIGGHSFKLKMNGDGRLIVKEIKG